MLSFSKIKPLKTWIGLRSQSLLSEEQVDLGPVSPNSMGHNEHKEDFQEEQVDTVARNDESAVDDVE